MNFLSMLLRILSIPIAIVGAFTCVVLIGFPIIMLAKDLNILADKINKNYE